MLGVVVAAAVVAAGIIVVPRVMSAADGCTGSEELRVVADPSIAEPLKGHARDIAAEGDHTTAGSCLTVTVTEVDDTAGTQAIADGTADLWIPRSQVWSTVTIDAEAVENLGSVAASPLVAVAQRSVASGMGWPDLEFSWGSVVGGDAESVLTDPVATAEGRAVLSAIHSVVGPGADQRQLVQVLSQVALNAVASVPEALETTTTSDTPVFTAMSEQAVIAHNASGGAGMVALYPQEGTYVFDYPALMSTSTDVPRPVVEAYLDELGADEYAAAIRSAGLRTADGTPSDTAGLVDGTNPAMPSALPEPDFEALAAVMRQWSALAIGMKMLAVVDVSGSMNEEVTGGATRIELTRDAAKSALGLLPTTSSVGLWAFSIEQDPPNDHVELVSVGPLEADLDGVPRLEAITAAADELPTLTQGGTGLYDTALAAFQHMRSGYEADKVNSVVLLTDGRNEDDPDGISLETLLNTLRAQFDPAKPVPIITIGMGPEPDMAALQQISEATGTKAYHAEDPRDIEQVFLDAMVERQCRPNC